MENAAMLTGLTEKLWTENKNMWQCLGDLIMGQNQEDREKMWLGKQTLSRTQRRVEGGGRLGKQFEAERRCAGYGEGKTGPPQASCPDQLGGRHESCEWAHKPESEPGKGMVPDDIYATSVCSTVSEGNDQKWGHWREKLRMWRGKRKYCDPGEKPAHVPWKHDHRYLQQHCS